MEPYHFDLPLEKYQNSFNTQIKAKACGVICSRFPPPPITVTGKIYEDHYFENHSTTNRNPLANP